VPRTANRLADEDALIEGSTVVGALPADGEPVGLDVNEQHRLTKSVAGDELTGADAAGLDSRGQVRPGQLIDV